MRNTRYKIWVIGAFLCAGLIVAWAKAGMLQLRRGEALKELADRQTLRPLGYSAGRGSIYDRNGRLLAQSVPMDSVYAEPRRIENVTKAARDLAKITGLSESALRTKLKQNRSFVWIARRVEPSIAQRVRSLSLTGIGLIQEEKRFYPNHAILGQLLGTVSVDGDGIGGIEQAFDKYLKPKAWKTLVYGDARGNSVRPGLAPTQKELAGGDVHLTIDSDLQNITEEVLQKAVETAGAKGGWALVIVPSTGEILAVANVPIMNPNEPSQVPQELRRNRAIAESFEPGSTFKLAIFAAALDAEVITPETRINCENGKMRVGNVVISDITKKEWLRAAEILKYSSNIGAYKVAEKVGKKRLAAMMRGLGFGSATGLNIVEEGRGQVTDPATWGLARFINISFGYGFMATTMQLLGMVSTVANGGMKVAPKIVMSAPVVKDVRVMKKKAAKALTEIMVEVTENGGTGHRAQIHGIRVAGKSGTAEKVDEHTARYNKSKNRSSFIGFAPAENPEIAAVVVIDEPKGIAYGGRVAAPAWQEIVESALVSRGLIAHPIVN